MMRSRRRFLGAVTAGTASLAGCNGLIGTGDGVDSSGSAASEGSDSDVRSSPADAAVPTADVDRHVPHELGTLRESAVSGGPGKDRIPSIDDPSFASADGVDLDDGEPIDGGYRVDGEVYDPDDLPLERTLAFDAMWFAWTVFYPETDYIE